MSMNHRRSIRLQEYHYTRKGVYFVTACTHRHRCLFGEVVDGEVRLSMYGRVAAAEWARSSEIRAEVRLDAWVVMPNHIHGIVVILPPDADPAVDYTDPHGYRMDMGATGRWGRGDQPWGRGDRPVAPTGTTTAIIGGNDGRVQMRRHETHQPGARHARRAGVAAQLLRTHRPQRTRMDRHPPVHRRKPGRVEHGSKPP